MNEKRYCYKYPRPAVTTDSVIFGFGDGELKVLLVERAREPFKGCWAFPGGFMEMHEDADTCACRELEEETGLCGVHMEQLYTFSAADRDPRYRVISIAYYALVNLSEVVVQAGDDAGAAQWFPLSGIPALAFDHRQILQIAIARLKGKVRYQPIGFELLPEKFTIPDLQRLYESVLQIALDGRNFRKKILSTGLLIDREEHTEGVSRKRAEYYSFDKAKYRALTEKGFYFEI